MLIYLFTCVDLFLPLPKKTTGACITDIDCRQFIKKEKRKYPKIVWDLAKLVPVKQAPNVFALSALRSVVNSNSGSTLAI